MNLNLDLNKKQKEAVLHDDGPALVVAGAGSGKTRVITYRIARLIKEGVFPSEILTVTFTNKAASEMEERVKKIVDCDISSMWIGTFHSMCLKILSENLDKIGYKPNYLIYDTDDSVKIVSDIINSMGLDDNVYEDKKIFYKITEAKMNLISFANYLQKLDREPFDRDRNIQKIYEQYYKRLRHNNAFDFTDLITKTIYLFRKYPEVLERYQTKFQYVQCDEYQDTNHSQYMILQMLADKHKNLMVVGDSDQSIYGFRGANIQNIIDFEKEYKNVNIIKLERNYRSTANIIKSSNAVVENNNKRREKVAFTEAKPGFPVVVAETHDSYKEADFVTNTIKTLTETRNYDYKDITLLYRSNYQSQNFETAFVNAGIPYSVVKGLGFFDRKEIKDLLAFIRLTANLDDSPSLNRVINLESNGIGPVTVSRLLEHSYNEMIPLVDVVKSPTSVNGIGNAKGEAVLKMYDEYLKPIEKIQEEDLGLQEIILRIYEDVHFEDILMQDEETYENKMKNIEAFFDFVNNYVEKNSNDDTLIDFLQNVKLISDQDELDKDSNKVKLMTVHAAKGLEFPIVFMVGMEEESFPHKFSLQEPDGEEEERRLCYVAMTRAEERLFLTYCKRRFQFYQFVDKEPSRFIDEIPMQYSKFMIYDKKDSRAM